MRPGLPPFILFLCQYMKIDNNPADKTYFPPKLELLSELQITRTHTKFCN